MLSEIRSHGAFQQQVAASDKIIFQEATGQRSQNGCDKRQNSFIGTHIPPFWLLQTQLQQVQMMEQVQEMRMIRIVKYFCRHPLKHRKAGESLRLRCSDWLFLCVYSLVRYVQGMSDKSNKTLQTVFWWAMKATTTPYLSAAWNLMRQGRRLQELMLLQHSQDTMWQGEDNTEVTAKHKRHCATIFLSEQPAPHGKLTGEHAATFSEAVKPAQLESNFFLALNCERADRVIAQVFHNKHSNSMWDPQSTPHDRNLVTTYL